jgi:hypothetical protein
MKRLRAPDVELTPSGELVRIRSNSDFDWFLQAPRIRYEDLRFAQPLLPAIVPAQILPDARTERKWDAIYQIIYKRTLKTRGNYQTAWRRTLVQLASNSTITFPLSFILKKAADLLDEENLIKFLKGIVAKMKSKDWRNRPLFDPVDNAIISLWNSFHVFRPDSRHTWTLPPLSRWSGPAAQTLLAKLLPKHGLGRDGATYRKRLERLFLTIEKPVFVRKLILRETGEDELDLSPEGIEWLNGLKTVTRTPPKKCHARE